jgi:hypothetical protein
MKGFGFEEMVFQKLKKKKKKKKKKKTKKKKITHGDASDCKPLAAGPFFSGGTKKNSDLSFL